MPLFRQYSRAACCWSIWKVTESTEELLAMLPHEGAAYRQKVCQFAAETRRQEWLAVRVLLYVLLGEEKEIAYCPNGKPYLADGSASISISHTRGYVAVLLGAPGEEMGIDIEYYGDRVRRVASRFMRDDECLFSFRGTDLWMLLLHWSAKEAMFKCLNAAEVDFRTHLHILPFQPDVEGEFFAAEYRTERQLKFSILYTLFPDFVLTVCRCL